MGFNAVNAKEAEENFVENPCELTRNKLIMHHTGLVHMIARKYAPFVADSYYDDLFQEGMIGLMVAAKRFKPGKNVKFCTYASWWVRSHVQIFITDERATYFNTLKKLAFDRNPGKKLPNEEERRAQAIRYPINLNDPVNAWTEGGGGTWQEIIADKDVELEKTVIDAQQAELLYTIAEPFLLKNGYRPKIFAERIMADEPKTLVELGKEIGLSREGVRLHEKALLKEIREAYREYCEA